MDTIPLVAEQIADGQRLMDRLVQDAFPVTEGCWAIVEDDSQWYLYLVSPVVDAAGPIKAYGRVLPVVRELEQTSFVVDPFQVKLIGPSEPLARGLAELHRQSRVKRPGRYEGVRIGEVNVQIAFIYPPVVAAG